MKDLIGTHCAAALCGSMTATLFAKTETFVEHPDGSVEVICGTQGNNENYFKVRTTATESAAKQLKIEYAKAVKKGDPAFRFQGAGPIEADTELSKVGKEATLSLHLSATLIRPVHPNPSIDPTMNAAMIFGRARATKFGSLEIQFGHLQSALDDSTGPVAVPLSRKSSEDLIAAGATDQDVMLSGVFTRQTNETAEGAIPAHDKISFTVDGAQKIELTATRTRYPGTKKVVNSAVTADYEDGYDTDDTKNSSSIKAEYANIDF